MLYFELLAQASSVARDAVQADSYLKHCETYNAKNCHLMMALLLLGHKIL